MQISHERSAGAVGEPGHATFPPLLSSAADPPSGAAVARWDNEGGAGAGGETAPGSLRILVIEDDAIIGMLLGELLEAMGHDVVAIAADEAAAVAAAALHRPDLLMVDVTLGEGSGIDAAETINRAGHVPHLYTTGDALKVKRLRPDAVVIQKPFDEPDLASAIARAMAA